MATSPFPVEASVLPAPMMTRAAALAGAGGWRCELADQRLAWAPGVHALFGLEPGRPVDRREAVALYTPETRRVMERLRADAIERGSAFTFDAELVRPDGTRRWMRVWGEVERRGGRAVALNGWKQDVTADRAAIAEWRRRAERDPLTGLSNRAAFLDRIGRDEDSVLVLFDLDGFKAVNDHYGHGAGDHCLRVLGERMLATFPDAAIVARLGGDEFAVLLPARTPRLALARRIGAAAKALSLPVEWDGRLLRFGVSGGIAFANAARQEVPGRWMAAADAALYEAKRMGRGRVRIAPA